MSIFRLSDNVPNTYVDQSRDFQLLCALFDLVQNSTKHQIDSMLSMLITEECPDALLPLLQRKLGFFISDSSYYSSDDIRRILVVFCYIVRNKGSRIGIQYAINTFTSLLKVDGIAYIDIDNNTADNNYRVVVKITAELTDTRILRDILQYVMPAGYVVECESVSSSRAHSILKQSDVFLLVGSENNSDVQAFQNPSSETTYTRNQLFNIGGVGTATVSLPEKENV